MAHSTGRLILLDLIRFIAAMAVLIFHYKSKYIETLQADTELASVIYSVTKFGYLGVDLFFLISGFVIFASALKRTPTQFLISRTTRIYPTFWACLIITCLLILIYPDPPPISLSRFLSNLTLLHSYLDIASVDGVYWTLLVELKFYSCIFVLMLLGWLKFYRVWLLIWLVLTVMFVLFHQPFFLGWFISPEYSPYFISGIIFYLAQREGYSKLYVSVLGIAFVMALRHAYIAVDSFSHDISPIDRYIVMAIVTSFYGVFYLISRKSISLKYRSIYVILGGMTYPLYLLHNTGGKLTFDFFVSFISPLPLLVLITLIVMGLSYVINVWLEKRLANQLKVYLLKHLER